MDKFKLCVRNSFQLHGAFELYGADSRIVNADNILENHDSVYYLMTQSCYSDATLLNILPLVDFDGHANVQACSIYKNIIDTRPTLINEKVSGYLK
jgi:hypothetical protein